MRSYKHFQIWRFFSAFLFFFSTILVLDNPTQANTNRKLVFAIDGLSYSAFQEAQKRGLFPIFQFSGRHIAPYPAMTEPSWTEVLHGTSVFPFQGEVKSIESKYFDLDASQTVDDPRLLFHRYASPYNFMRAFDFYLSPYLEPLLYFPNDDLVQKELRDLESNIYENFTGNHYIAYISSVDAIAHTQAGQLFPLLESLSRLISRVQDHYEKSHSHIDIWIVSDHGNIGNFQEGQTETPLFTTHLQEAASKAGLEIVEGKLSQPNHIAIPIMALGNSATVYFKDLSQRKKFALHALENPAVDLVTYLEVQPQIPGVSKRIKILGRNQTEANIYWDESRSIYAYEAVSGNPIHIAEEFTSQSATELKWIPDSVLFDSMVISKDETRLTYPDAIYRLVMGVRQEVNSRPDLIVNLKDNYCFEGAFSKHVRMIRTHGSLSAGSSLGILASTSSPIPPFIRSEKILETIGISAKTVFHRVENFFHKSKEETLKQIGKTDSQIPTRLKDFSQETIFLRMTKWISTTLDALSVQDFSELFFENLLKTSSFQEKDLAGLMSLITDQSTRFDPKKVFSHINFSQGIEATFQQVVNRTELPIAQLDSLQNSEQSKLLKNGTGNWARKLGMKLYTIPFVLNELLNISENEFEKDTRDSQFASDWFSRKKQEVIQSPDLLFREQELAAKLFSSIFEERKLLQSLYPATFPLFYNPISKEITVVFVPGIYNELFDTEIFSRGLRALRDHFGIRVIYAHVDGRCSSTYNAQSLMTFLKKDTESRLSRGYSRPKYLVIGYSKGGVDATEALLLDTKFTRSQILGLVSIASPHHGSSILESADLPSIISEALVQKPVPLECKNNSASTSLLPSTRASFWNQNLSQLIGLTRFYSLSFVSDTQNSHPWMKISKLIGQFGMPNDGVVTLESSHFPSELRAVDFGTIQADHLAGILASSFPQGPFMEAILISLLETRAFNSKTIANWQSELFFRSPILKAAYHKKAFLQLLGIQIDQNQSRNRVLNLGLSEPKTPLTCSSQEELTDLQDFLANALKNTPYDLKPFRLICQPNQKLRLEIQAAVRFLFWTQLRYQNFEVNTFEDLVSTFLTYGLKSKENSIEDEHSHPTIPPSSRKPFALPKNSLSWTKNTIIKLKDLHSQLKEAKIPIIKPEATPEILIRCDHQSFKDFRKEYQFSYESFSPGAPGAIDDQSNGYIPVLDQAPNFETVCRMRSIETSIRLTTVALRFKASDFPRLDLKIKINQGIKNANPRKRSQDDSAFQVWFTLKKNDQEVKILGYYWGDENEEGLLKPGALIESSYSNFYIPFFGTLPEAWQFFLEGGTASEGKWFHFERNLMNDLRQAFPKEDHLEDWEIVTITLQTDAKDMKGKSEAFFKEMGFYSK